MEQAWDTVPVSEEKVTLPTGIRFVAAENGFTVDCPVIVPEMAAIPNWRSYWSAAVRRGLREVQQGYFTHVIEVAPRHYRVFSY